MDYILGFIVLLGVLIAIHEYGHYIVAKACDVRVEVFSIGFGKKLLSFQRGETVYTISLIPFGGYVKLTGQDPREEVPKEIEHRTLRAKPLWQRAAVVLAGPLFNAVLALIIYIGLVWNGIPSQAPELARVIENSPAYTAGLRTSDHIDFIKVNNQAVVPKDYNQFEKIVGASANQEITLGVRKSEIDNVREITITPTLGDVRNPATGVFEKKGMISGIEATAPAPVVYTTANSWAHTRLLPELFYVETLSYTDNSQGREIEITLNTLFDFEEAWKTAHGYFANAAEGKIYIKGKEIDFQSKEKNIALDQIESKTLTLAWTRKSDAIPQNLAAAGMLSSELLIREIVKGTPAEKIGLKGGDLLTRLNGQKIFSFNWFLVNLQLAADSPSGVSLDWLRNGKKMSARIEPELRDATDDYTQTTSKRFQIGAMFGLPPAQPKMIIVKADGFFDAVKLGSAYTWSMTSAMVMSFYHLATGKIAFKTLGGFISIAKFAGDSWSQGFTPFFRMMAIISLNLFILNLIPIPVLDGGHLLLYCIESIRRKPLSLKIIEVWSATGLIMLLGLMALVTFNDISRFIVPFFN